MDLANKLQLLDLRSTFLTGTALPHHRKNCLRIRLRQLPTSIPTQTKLFNSEKNLLRTRKPTSLKISAKSSSAVSVVETSVKEDIEALLSDNSFSDNKRSNRKSNTGASSISSGVRLENIRKSYKGVTVLKDVTWEVKKGQKVGLVGVNGAGKTTQLRIITGQEEPDSGNVIKAKENMKIAFLSQEFEVSLSKTVKEEFQSAFKEEMEIAERLEKVQNAIGGSVDDLGLMGRLLDELDLLQRRAKDLDLNVIDVKINKLMPELGFTPEDSERLVASFSSGWQMRMSIGKILLQEQDLFKCEP